MTFGQWLHQERTRRGWTLEVMAAKMDSVHSSISRLETGRSNPSAKMAIRIADALAGEDATPETMERLRNEARAARAGLEPATTTPEESEFVRAMLSATPEQKALIRAMLESWGLGIGVEEL